MLSSHEQRSGKKNQAKARSCGPKWLSARQSSEFQAHCSACNYSAPHRIADDGNDGYWSFEHALTPEFNPETGECQINAREKYLRKHGRRILPAVCAKTPPRIPTPFGQHQVESDTYPQLHAPRFNIGYTPRLSKNYAKQSISITKQRASNPFIYTKDESLDPRFWNQFHMDFYTSVCLRSKNPHITPVHAIDWDHMANMEMVVCDNVIEACEAFGLKEIMAFRYD